MKLPLYPASEANNFGGLDFQNYAKAKVAIFPVPYDSTTYYKPGTKEGPRAIIDASRHMEVYDIESGQSIKDTDVFTLEELEPSKNSPKETLLRIEKVIAQILADKKIPFMLGGEHSITAGAIWAFVKAQKDFSVLQIDAHSDLRDVFEGTKFHHASVMRRVREKVASVVQVGIRSMCQEEAEYIEKKKIKNIFFAPKLPVEEILFSLKKNVYLTFDIDALDPSIMPATGTPEPGGLGWYETLEFLDAVAKTKNIIGADLVELSPIPGLIFPDFLAAKLAYKITNHII
ncbi:agmatinase [Patescibacteria group bacterium]|nr:agmatinase [Patescibacteria group bacterium]MBU4466487.1 agmatinase [Patescibacteria group bacterium]